MLVARPSKRTGSVWFVNDMRFDILSGERPLGRLSLDRRNLGSAFTVDDSGFTVEHTRGAEEETLYEAAARLATRRPKPPPDRYELKDAGARVLAVADQDGEVFLIQREARRFRFAKGRSRRSFDLCEDGDQTPLGSVGQRKFWTTSTHMDLPDAFGAPFQVFLLSVLLALILQRSATLAGAQ
jgi:hypothetical protein